MEKQFVFAIFIALGYLRFLLAMIRAVSCHVTSLRSPNRLVWGLQ